MSINNLENVTELIINDALIASRTIDVAIVTTIRTTNKSSEDDSRDTVTTKSAAARASKSMDLDTSRSSDSGKSSSCSPTLLDCSFDSGIAGVLLDSNKMQLHKQIQQCQRIILALERDREHFCTIRNRLSKITERKKKQLNDSEFFCNVCCAEIDPEDAKTYVKCYICQKHICRSIKCADWLAQTAQWECELCQTSKESMAQTSSWVADQISFNQEKLVYPIRARSEIFIPISECNDSSIHFESVSQIGANSAVVTAEQKVKIREYVEEVVANLLGGNLDTISVNQLSKSENYLPAPKSNGGQYGQQNGSVVLNNSQRSREVTPISANVPDFTHISENRLRQMILKIIAETQNMPPLSTTHAVSEISLDRLGKAAENMPLTNGHRHRTEHYFEPTIYQDLLATAVLNKIVDKQLKSHDISERLPDITRGHGGDCVINAVLDENFNVEHHSITSGSSVEPRSDCSYTDMDQILNTNDDKSLETDIINADRESVMSDYLANHMVPLPNLSEMATESEDDDYMSVTSSAVGDGNWENNWLFKKKKPTLGGNVAATSIGMLVPDPKEDVRAKIGDKAADEVSDLSELGSDTDDSLDILRSKLDPINDRLINKHLIGGQNSKVVLDELIERSSMISNTLPADLEEALTETCNEHVIDASTKSQAINVDVNQQPSCNAEQEGSVVILPPAGFEDLNSNPLTANDDFTESESCTGFSTIEIVEQTVRTPSVFEILAAMALGPMLAIPAVDQPTAVTASELTALNELKDLALAEIKARYVELTPHSLSVIPEEPGEHFIDIKCIPTPDEISKGIANEFENNLIASLDDSDFRLDAEKNADTFVTDASPTTSASPVNRDIKSTENNNISDHLEKTVQTSDSITTLLDDLTTCVVENTICPIAIQPLFKTGQGSFESTSQNSDEILSKLSVPYSAEVIKSNLDPSEECNQLEKGIISKEEYLKQPLEEFNTAEAPNKISLAEESTKELTNDTISKIQSSNDTLSKIQTDILTPISDEKNTFKIMEHNEASLPENTVEYNPLQEENKIFETECLQGSTAQYSDNYTPKETAPCDEQSVDKTTRAVMETPETIPTCEYILAATETKSLCETPVSQYTEELTLAQTDKDVFEESASNCLNPDEQSMKNLTNEQTENSVLESTSSVIETNENYETSILECFKGEAQSENQDIGAKHGDYIPQSIEQYSEIITLPSEEDEKLSKKDNISQTTQLEIQTTEESNHPQKTKCDISEAGQFAEIVQLECEKQYFEILTSECSNSEVSKEEHITNEVIVTMEINISETVNSQESELIGIITEENTNGEFSETSEHIPTKTTILQYTEVSDSSNYQYIKSETPETQTIDISTQHLTANNITPQPFETNKINKTAQVITPSEGTECDTQLVESKNINSDTAPRKDLSENRILNTETMECAKILTTNCDDSKMEYSNLDSERENNIGDIISINSLMENTIGEAESSDDKESLSQLTQESETTVQVEDESTSQISEKQQHTMESFTALSQNKTSDTKTSDKSEIENNTNKEPLLSELSYLPRMIEPTISEIITSESLARITQLSEESNKLSTQSTPLDISPPLHLESIESSTGLSEIVHSGCLFLNMESKDEHTEGITHRENLEYIISPITKSISDSNAESSESIPPPKDEIILKATTTECVVQLVDNKFMDNSSSQIALSDDLEYTTKTIGESIPEQNENISEIPLDFIESNIIETEMSEFKIQQTEEYKEAATENPIPEATFVEGIKYLTTLAAESTQVAKDELPENTEISHSASVIQPCVEYTLELSDEKNYETEFHTQPTVEYIPVDREIIETASPEFICLNKINEEKELQENFISQTDSLAKNYNISIEVPTDEQISETEFSKCPILDTNQADVLTIILERLNSETASVEDSGYFNQHSECALSGTNHAENTTSENAHLTASIYLIQSNSETASSKCCKSDIQPTNESNDVIPETVFLESSESFITTTEESETTSLIKDNITAISQDNSNIVLFVTGNYVSDDKISEPDIELTIQKSIKDTTNAEEFIVALQNPTSESTPLADSIFITQSILSDGQISEKPNEKNNMISEAVLDLTIEKSEAPKDEKGTESEISKCSILDTNDAEESTVTLQNSISNINLPSSKESNDIISETVLLESSESFIPTTEISETTVYITTILGDNSNIALFETENFISDDKISEPDLELIIEESFEAPKDEIISETEICCLSDSDHTEESTVPLQNPTTETAHESDSIFITPPYNESISSDGQISKKPSLNCLISKIQPTEVPKYIISETVLLESCQTTQESERTSLIKDTITAILTDNSFTVEGFFETPKEEQISESEILKCSIPDTNDAEESTVTIQNSISKIALPQPINKDNDSFSTVSILEKSLSDDLHVEDEELKKPLNSTTSSLSNSECPLSDTNHTEEYIVTFKSTTSETAPLTDSIFLIQSNTKYILPDDHNSETPLNCSQSDIQPTNESNDKIAETIHLESSESIIPTTEVSETISLIKPNITAISTENSNIVLFATENFIPDDKISEADLKFITKESIEAPKVEIITEISVHSLLDTSNEEEFIVPLQNATSVAAPMADSIFITLNCNESIVSDGRISEKTTSKGLTSEIQPTTDSKHTTSEIVLSESSESSTQTAQESDTTSLTEDNITAILTDNSNITLLVKDDRISEVVLEFSIEESIEAPKDEKMYESEISKCCIPDTNDAEESTVTLQNSISDAYLPSNNESNDIISETVLLEASESFIPPTEVEEISLINDNIAAISTDNTNIANLVKDEKVLEFTIEESLETPKDERIYESEILKYSIPDTNYAVTTTEVSETTLIKDNITAISPDNSNIVLFVTQNYIPDDKISEADLKFIIKESIEAPKVEIITEISVHSLMDTANEEEFIVPLQNATSVAAPMADSIFVTPNCNESILSDDRISENTSSKCLTSEIQPTTDSKHTTSEIVLCESSESSTKTAQESDTTSLIEDNITEILTDNSNITLLVKDDRISEAVLEFSIEESIEAPKDEKMYESEISKCCIPDTNDAEESTVTLQNSISEAYLPSNNESNDIISETVLLEASEYFIPPTEVEEISSLIKDNITAISTDNTNIANLVKYEKVLEFTIEESLETPKDERIYESEILKYSIPDTNYAVTTTEVSETTLIKDNITAISPDNSNIVLFVTQTYIPDDKISEPDLEIITEECFEARNDEIISETELTVHSLPDTTNAEEFIVPLQQTASESTPLTDSIITTQPYNEALLSDGQISEKTFSKCLISETQPTTESNNIITETLLSESSESFPQTSEKSETTSLIKDIVATISPDNSNIAVFVTENYIPEDKISDPDLEIIFEESIKAPKEEVIYETEITVHSLANTTSTEELIIPLQKPITEGTPMANSILITQTYNESSLSDGQISINKSSKCLISDIQPNMQPNDIIYETVVSQSSESFPQTTEKSETTSLIEDTNIVLLQKDDTISKPVLEFPVEESIHAPKDEKIYESEILKCSIPDTNDEEESTVALQNSIPDSCLPRSNESNDIISETILLESSGIDITTTEKSETTSLITDNITAISPDNSNIVLFVTENNIPDDKISEPDLKFIIEESIAEPKEEIISETEITVHSSADTTNAEEFVVSLQIPTSKSTPLADSILITPPDNECVLSDDEISEKQSSKCLISEIQHTEEAKHIISETVPSESSEKSETSSLIEDNNTAILTDNSNYAFLVKDDTISAAVLEFPIEESIEAPKDEQTSESKISKYSKPDTNDAVESVQNSISETYLPSSKESKDKLSETALLECSESFIPTTELAETTSLIESNITEISMDQTSNMAHFVTENNIPDDKIPEPKKELVIEESIEATKDEITPETEIPVCSLSNTTNTEELLVPLQNPTSESTCLEDSIFITPHGNESISSDGQISENPKAKDDIISVAVLDLIIEESIDAPKDEIEIAKCSILDTTDAEESPVRIQNSISKTYLPRSNESNDIISETVFLESSFIPKTKVSETTSLVESNITAISKENSNIALFIPENNIPDVKISEPDLELVIEESIEAPKDELIRETEIIVHSLANTTNDEEFVVPLQNPISESTPLTDSIFITPPYNECILSDDQMSEKQSSNCLISEIEPTTELKHLISETVLSECSESLPQTTEKSETKSLIEDNITAILIDNSNNAILVKDDVISEAVLVFPIEESIEAQKDEQISESEIAKCPILDTNDAEESTVTLQNSISETYPPSNNESNDISETVLLESSESYILATELSETTSLIEDNITAISTDNTNISLFVTENYIPDDKILEPDLELITEESIEAPKDEIITETENSVYSLSDATFAEEFVVPVQNPTSETAPMLDSVLTTPSYNESILSEGQILEKQSLKDEKISESELSICSTPAEESNVTLQKSIIATVLPQASNEENVSLLETSLSEGIYVEAVELEQPYNSTTSSLTMDIDSSEQQISTISSTLASNAPPILYVKHDTVTKESSSTPPPTVLNDLIAGSIETVTTNISAEERDSLDETISPTLTRQSTVVEIDPTVSGPVNNIIESVKSQSLDQLINDTDRNDDSRTTTVKEYIGIYPDESDILANNFKISPPCTTNTTYNYTHTNTITKKSATYDIHQHKSINGNKHKRPEKPSNNFLLTSAVQNQESPQAPACLEQHVYNERVSNRREAHDEDDDDGDSVGVQVDFIEEHDEDEEVDDDDDEVAILRHFVPGSIAEREYKKWNNAVEMPNNPYAPEALKRRISGSQERFIDLPNISPTQEQNPLEILDKNKLDVEETDQRENDYKRYSRDYYINNGCPSPQTSPAREMAATPPTKDNIETVQNITEIDLYKAIPAQVVEDTISQQSMQSENTTTSDDSDTIRIYDFKKQATTVLKDANTQEVEGKAKAVVKPQVRPTNLSFNKSDLGGNVTTAARGSTPTAFKFLQPKRKLVDPSQVLSVDEDESTPVISPLEKPAIEQDVVHVLPSVKALAKAFLMTAKATQPENRWLRKVKTLSQGAKTSPATTVKSIDQICLEAAKAEEDVTITSDLSSLETDTSSVFINDQTETTKDILPTSPHEDKDAVAVRQGGLKNNIAFFENLKFK